ncbi:hypothetical protein SeLEV6574_g05091 [Synchytrium endobioticum]|uniref:UBA domain-containing protein n=1 Tax=Synchytrium endobioticum TaxID=286115 RepID=A0A507CWG6_9FUNG|nr:hypothetical protein SeLEV6574_g05091 [Synchytrium endobioticum]
MLPTQGASRTLWPLMEDIENIAALGFTHDQAIRALKHSNGNMDAAAEWLFSGAGDLPVSTAPAPAAPQPATSYSARSYGHTAPALNQLAMAAGQQESEEEQMQRALAMSLESANIVTPSATSPNIMPSTPNTSRALVSLPPTDIPWSTDVDQSHMPETGWDTSYADMGWDMKQFDSSSFLGKRHNAITPCGLAPSVDYPLFTGLIQALYAIPEVRYTVARLPRSEAANRPGYELQNLFAAMSHSDRKNLDPMPFIASIKIRGGQSLEFKELVRRILNRVTSGGSTAFKDLASIEIVQESITHVPSTPPAPGTADPTSMKANPEDNQQQHRSTFQCLELNMVNVSDGVPLEYAVKDYFHNLLIRDTKGDVSRRYITRFPSILFIQPGSGVAPRLIKMDGMFELAMGRFGIPYEEYCKLDRINVDLERIQKLLAYQNRLENLGKVVGVMPTLQQAIVAKQQEDGRNSNESDFSLNEVQRDQQQEWESLNQRYVTGMHFVAHVYKSNAEELNYCRTQEWSLQQAKNAEENRHFKQCNYVLMAVMTVTTWGTKLDGDTTTYVKDLAQHKKWWSFRNLDANVIQVEEDFVQGALMTHPIYALVYALPAALARGADIRYPTDAVEMILRENAAMTQRVLAGSNINDANASASKSTIEMLDMHSVVNIHTNHNIPVIGIPAPVEAPVVDISVVHDEEYEQDYDNLESESEVIGDDEVVDAMVIDK